MNTAAFLDASARGRPEAILAIHEGRRFTYDALHRAANQVANGLSAAGFGPGDRIALCAPNRPGFIAAYYGILKIGATVVVMSTGLKQRDFDAQLRDCGASALLCFDGFDGTDFAQMAVETAIQLDSCRGAWIVPSDLAAPSPIRGVPSLANLMESRPTAFATVAVDADDTAIIPYTSGTTGRPKGVEITHANILAMVSMNVPLGTWNDGRVRLVATPLFHIMAQVSGLAFPVLCGQTLVLMDRFEPAWAWRLIRDEGVSYLTGPPPLFRALVETAGDDAWGRGLKLCGTGAAPLPPSLSETFQARFGTPLRAGYGATETTSVATWHCPADPIRASTVGRPIPGVHVRIVDSRGHGVAQGEAGEILVRSPGLMKGYWNQPDATRKVLKRGWYHTGDIGAFDEAGYLKWIGRADDVIVRWTGTNVSPTEIEHLIQSHPMVSQAAVVGVADPDLGQRVVAVVAARDGCRLEESTLSTWLAGQLPDNLMPDSFEFRSTLPMTETGKVARHLLKAPR